MPKSASPDQPSASRLSRRELLRSMALGGSGLLGAYLLACKSEKGGEPPTAVATPTPGQTATLSPAALRWQQFSPAGALPPGRHDHSLVTDGGRLYLFGGRGPDTMADLWVFDLAANAWTEISAFGPQARFGHNAVWDSGRNLMVLFGGQDGSTFFNDIWEFDPATSAWAQVSFAGSAPAARYGAGAALDGDGRLLITHGFTSQGRFDDTWQHDLAARSWTDVSPAAGRPIERCLMRGVWDSLEERLIIFGGQTNGTPFLDDLWAWSMATEWRQLAREPHPSARTFYSMVFDSQSAQIILFGGNTAQGPVNDLWSFRSSGESWTQVAATGTAPAPRYGHDAALAAQGQSVFMFGGTDGTNFLNDLWTLAPES